MPARARLADITIANGATDSSAVIARGMRYAGFALQMPATFTGTSISFKGSHDNTTFQPIYDIAGSLVTTTVAASRGIDVPGEVGKWPYWKVVSGSSEGAARTIGVVGLVETA